MKKDEIQDALRVLGGDGVLDALLALREIGWCTASELADVMNTHVATAVKRLSGLHEIGYLEKRTRKGRTRSAQEYRLMANRFTIEMDLDALSGAAGKNGHLSVFFTELMGDMAKRLGRFGGGDRKDIIARWSEAVEDPIGILKMLADKKSGDFDLPKGIDDTYLARLISDILDYEADMYGELTVRALAKASLDAVGGRLSKEELLELAGALPSRFFGGN